MLLVTRALAGIGGGGVLPVTLGLVGDLFPLRERQVALSKILAGAMAGNLLGATMSGLIGDFIGWRGVLIAIGVVVFAASAAVGWGFRDHMRAPRRATSVADTLRNYRAIFAHPHARACYGGVFVEGICVLGLFPFIAAFLAGLGEPRPSIAGLVIAGFPIGGLVYTSMVSRVLPRIGVQGLIVAGGALMASQLVAITLGPPWQVQFACFLVMGCGFYMLHGSLQTFASEISIEARGTAVAMHAFCFFLGQTVGPIAYGLGLAHAGKAVTLSVAAVIMLLLGIVCARLLAHRRGS